MKEQKTNSISKPVESKTISVKVKVNTDSVDGALDKVKELYEKITEVKTLADEVTTVISDLKLEIKL